MSDKYKIKAQSSGYGYWILENDDHFLYLNWTSLKKAELVRDALNEHYERAMQDAPIANHPTD